MTQWFHYYAYGRRCASAVALPELAVAREGRSDFTFEVTYEVFEHPLHWAERVGTDDETSLAYAYEHDVSWFWFVGKAMYRCRVDRNGTIHVLGTPKPGVPLSTVRHHFVDDVMPALLAMEEPCCVFHSAAVVVPEGAVLIAGDSGMGKSTLAASFALNGFAILSDDCVVVDMADGIFVAQPSYPSVRLWRRARALCWACG